MVRSVAAERQCEVVAQWPNRLILSTLLAIDARTGIEAVLTTTVTVFASFVRVAPRRATRCINASQDRSEHRSNERELALCAHCGRPGIIGIRYGMIACLCSSLADPFTVGWPFPVIRARNG